MKEMLKNKTVLIIEDNPADAFFCEEILIDNGVLSANIEAISKIAELDTVLSARHFDVVLLDLFLPDSNGFDTFDKVKAKLWDAVIIVMSGLRDQDTALNAVYKGAQDFILKDELDAKLLKKTIVYGFERKKNLQLLKESENKYKSLFDLSPLPLILFDLSTLKILEVNRAALKLYNYTRNELTKLSLMDLFYNRTEDYIKVFAANENSTNCKHRNKQGEIIVTDSYVRKTDGKQHILLVKDVTEQVQFEKKKMNLINVIQDEERKHFAMELHDGLAQQLVLINIYLNQINSSNEAADLISKCKEISNNALSQTRVLTYNIKPPFLEEGLVNAITALFNRLSLVNQTTVELSVLDDRIKEMKFSYETSYNVFRIVQEFINNSLKHGRSRNINCAINTIEDQVYFEVSDNGVGFDENTIEKGMGINNMKERLKLYTENHELKSILGKGTRLYFVVDTE